MRAIWYNLPDWSLNPKDFLKQEWKNAFKEKLYAMVGMQTEGTLPQNMVRNTVYEVRYHVV